MTAGAIGKNNLENDFQNAFLFLYKAFSAFPQEPLKLFKEGVKNKILDSLNKELSEASSTLDDLKSKIQNAPIHEIDAFYEEMYPYIDAFNHIEEKFKKDVLKPENQKEKEFLDLIDEIFNRWNKLFDEIEEMIEDEALKQNTKIAIQTIDQG